MNPNVSEERTKPSFVLLLMCRAILLSVPLAAMFNSIAVALGSSDTPIIWVLCSILSFIPIVLYENLVQEHVIYSLRVKK